MSTRNNPKAFRNFLAQQQAEEDARRVGERGGVPVGGTSREATAQPPRRIRDGKYREGVGMDNDVWRTNVEALKKQIARGTRVWFN